MLNANLLEILLRALVCENLLDRRQIVDRNVQATVNAQAIWRVIIKNVEILVLDRADKIQNVMLLIILQCAFVYLGILVILSPIVPSFNSLHCQRFQLLAHQIRVDQMLDVVKRMV